MSGAGSTAAGVTFLWLGMVLAISFLEAPLEFRAPGVTLQIGLGIGRLVFKALNAIEVVLAVSILSSLAAGSAAAWAAAALVAATVVLALQLVTVRPRLSRRSDAVLAGEEGPRSRAHLAYAGLEVVKALALVVGGAVLFAFS